VTLSIAEHMQLQDLGRRIEALEHRPAAPILDTRALVGLLRMLTACVADIRERPGRCAGWHGQAPRWTSACEPWRPQEPPMAQPCTLELAPAPPPALCHHPQQLCAARRHHHQDVHAVAAGSRLQRLSRRDVGRVLKGLAKRAKLASADDFSAHSLRVGMAQDLVKANFSLPAVMDAGGWQSPTMVARYNRKRAAETGAIAQYHAARHK
jgi:Phage integrase family